jgi:16S rRNA (cytosine967-C5)-methyltransferase
VSVPGIRSAYYLAHPGEPNPGFVYADAASTAVGLAVDAQPGEMVLDMAAAPGGKTMHLVDHANAGATVVAMDAHRRRLQSAQRRLARAGLNPHWLTADARRTPFRDHVFDAVLLDAPCTGLGTLRRRPEIAMRLESGAPENLARHQQKMLEEAWRVTRPGGRIVYSVCTLFAAETVDVVGDYPARPPADLPGRPWGKGLLLAPHLTGTDGMFIAVVDR